MNSSSEKGTRTAFQQVLNSVDLFNSDYYGDNPPYRTFGYQRRYRKPYAYTQKRCFGARAKRFLSQNARFLVRVSKVLVVLACFAAFLYYVAVFFKMYRQFNTLVDVDITFPRDVELPGITVCSSNVLRRNLFCKEYKKFCDASNQLLPEYEVRDVLALLNINTTRRLGHPWKEMIVSCQTSSKSGEKNVSLCDREMYLLYGNQNCYIINYDYSLNVSYVSPVLQNDTTFKMMFYINRDEYFLPATYGMEIYLHDPSGLPDSRFAHFLAKAGKSYIIGITKTTAKLLEKPYKTACKNYEDPSEDKPSSVSGVQVTNERLCREICLTTFSMAECNCTPNCVAMSDTDVKCQEPRAKHRECCTKIMDDDVTCSVNCPVACSVVTYDLSVDENDMMTSLEDAGISESQSIDQYTEVIIMLQVIKNTVYRHKPQVTGVEILGYVGGYLGIWLGVSVPLFYDYLCDFLKHFVPALKKPRKDQLKIQQINI